MRNHGALAPAGLCLAVALGAGTDARAADPSGTAIAVVQSTWASGDAGKRVLVATGPVYMGDVIRTSARGEAQIRFADDTRLVVGPNSSMTVDAFVFDNSGKARQVTLNAVRGAFRFITGSSRKSAYSIKTPTATIGVRGTEFDFAVDRRGQLNFALYAGAARICSRGRCTVLSGACSVAVIPRSGALRRLPAGNARTRLLSSFPYVASQARLNRAFRVDTSSCGIRKANVLPGAGSAPAFLRPPIDHVHAARRRRGRRRDDRLDRQDQPQRPHRPNQSRPRQRSQQFVGQRHKQSRRRQQWRQWWRRRERQ